MVRLSIVEAVSDGLKIYANSSVTLRCLTKVEAS